MYLFGALWRGWGSILRHWGKVTTPFMYMYMYVHMYVVVASEIRSGAV